MERKLFLLGNPRLEQDGISLELGRREAMALLAYLALRTQHQNQDDLFALLWPAFSHEDGHAALYQILSLPNKIGETDWSHAGEDSFDDRYQLMSTDLAV